MVTQKIWLWETVWQIVSKNDFFSIGRPYLIMNLVSSDTGVHFERLFHCRVQVWETFYGVVNGNNYKWVETWYKLQNLYSQKTTISPIRKNIPTWKFPDIW